jgi:FKBP-type peptidyl-prolyl cis-trans isomerase SlpA
MNPNPIVADATVAEPPAVDVAVNAASVVTPSSFVTLHYRLAGPDGVAIVNTFGDKPATFSLGSGAMSPGMEQRLLGIPEGSRRLLDLEPGEAFGDRNPALVQRVTKRLLAEWGDPDQVYIEGDVVQFPPRGAQREQLTGMVREVGDTWLTIDFNHPLAGLAVTLEVQIIGVL